jgi:ribosome biogenesis protein Nip4
MFVNTNKPLHVSVLFIRAFSEGHMSCFVPLLQCLTLICVVELFISVIKTSQFTLYGAQVLVCSQANTKHINTEWTERTVVEC